MTILFDMLSDPKCFEMRDPISKHVYESWAKNQIALAGNIPKYRISLEVMDIAHDLLDQLPDPVHDGMSKWMEFGKDGSRVGMLLTDDASCIMFAVNTKTRQWFDLIIKSDGNPFYPAGSLTDKVTDQATMVALTKARSWLLKALTLIQSPRIVEHERKTYDLPLQRARERSGKRPLSDHTEVVIHVTRREREAREHAAEHERRTGTRLHLVRAHYKMQRDKVIRIAEYWRGDASLGTKTTNRYRVTT